MPMIRTPFGTTSAGDPVDRITLKSAQLTVQVLTWGAVLQDVRLDGAAQPLTLGSPDLAAYEGRMKSFGAVMGPVVNRIRDARAPIGGVMHDFEANMDGQHTKHGGNHGPQNRVWDVITGDDTHVTLECVLPDGLSGFPGDRVIHATYRVDGPTLSLDLHATTTRPTLMNLANHSYWNLDGTDDITGHRLEIAAEDMTDSDAGLMVTGRVVPVAGTRFDFREIEVFAPREDARFDLNYCLSDRRRPLAFACALTGLSGVHMEMSTTEPGLQVFDIGSFSTDPHPGHGGAPYPRFSAIALEAQGWPDAANHPGFPAIDVTPDTPYHQITSWRFSR